MKLRKVNGRGRKTDDPRVLEIEDEKSIRAAAIGKATGMFYVPEVLQYDADQGILDTEWIDGLENLNGVALRRDPKMGELCHRTGVALAAIHEQLRLPEKLKIRLPEIMPTSSYAEVFLHGDFTGDNVCYDRKNDRLVIVDWSSAPLFGGKATFGPRYFDLIWFGHFFYCSRPARWMGIWGDDIWYQSLIRGYESTSGSRFAAGEFNDYRRKAEPLLSAARRDMLENKRGMRRIGRSLLLSYAAFRWQRMDWCSAK